MQSDSTLHTVVVVVVVIDIVVFVVVVIDYRVLFILDLCVFVSVLSYI